MSAATTPTTRRRNTQSHSSDEAGSIDPTNLLDLQSPPSVFSNNHSSNHSHNTDASRSRLKKQIDRNLEMKMKTDDCNHKESRLFVADRELGGESVDSTAGLHRLLLRSREDCYDGVLIDPSGLPLDPHEFVVRLKASLLHWRNQVSKSWLPLLCF